MTTDQKVDVLSALNLYGVDPEVCAAVAELIEAVKENRLCLQEFANDASQTIYIRFDDSERRLLKALARIGGAA